MTDRIKIHVIQNGFKFYGKILNEDTESISILDDKTLKSFTFPKTQIYIERD